MPGGCPGVRAALGWGCAAFPSQASLQHPFKHFKGGLGQCSVPQINHLGLTFVLWSWRITFKVSPQIPCPKILGTEAPVFTTKEVVPWEYHHALGDPPQLPGCRDLLRS